MDEKKIIGEVESGDQTKVQVALCKYKNNWFLDIRKHIVKENDSVPLKKGIRINSETAVKLFLAISKAIVILDDGPDNYFERTSFKEDKEGSVVVKKKQEKKDEPIIRETPKVITRKLDEKVQIWPKKIKKHAKKTIKKNEEDGESKDAK